MGSMIEVHVVQDMPLGAGNRGRDGRPKTVFWGGSQRIRVSSQSWRRAMRNWVLDELASTEESRVGHAWRTRRLPRLVAEALEARGVSPEDSLLLARTALAAGLHSSNGDISGTNQLSAQVVGDDDDDLTAPMLVFPEGAPQSIADAILAAQGELPDVRQVAEAWNDGWVAVRDAERAASEARAAARAAAAAGEGSPDENGEASASVATRRGARNVNRVEPPADPEVPVGVRGAVQAALHDTGALDVWLFGRFVAVLPDAKVDGALQVAHAVGTGINGEVVDFFVAVDDLVRSDEAAVGHVGADRVLAGGTLYRHMVLDLAQLVENMDGADQSLVRFAASIAIRAFIQSVPHSGATGAAPATVPHLVLGGAGRHVANMVDAYQVPATGVTAADRLCRAWERKRVGLFAPAVSAGWAGSEVVLPDGVRGCATPDELVDVLVSSGLSGEDGDS